MSTPLSPQDFLQQVSTLKRNASYQHSIHNGQKPHTFMISCCDSRVDPTILFGADVGDVFSLRIIANLVPHHSAAYSQCATAAAILFAVEQLHVPRIVVLGHSDCGGIQALCQHQASHTPNAIDSWLSCALDSLTHPLHDFPEAIATKTDQQSLRTLASSYHHLFTYPVIQKALKAGALSIEGWFYHMATTSLYTYHADENIFVLAAS
jgi:carbonic anhydrase